MLLLIIIKTLSNKINKERVLKRHRENLFNTFIILLL
jgi:hypothetical protein